MFLSAQAASANALHKTDGSHTNRPFFRALCRTSGKPPFLRKTSSPAVSFVSFLQEKKPYPLLFFLEEKTVSLRGKRSPSDGRLLFFLEEKKQKKIICGKAIILHCCLFSQRAMQNGRFVCEPSVFPFRAGRAGNRLFSERHPPPQCLLFLFFKKRKRSPLEEKKTSPFIEEKKSFPLYVPGIRLIKKLAR